MCGIAGILNRDTNRDIPAILAAMNAAQFHRGPDDAGVYLTNDGRGGLANRRLAIRDISAAGHMPMSGAAGTVTITYNGELYNAGELRTELKAMGHAFSSRSDTEIILQGYLAWNTQVLERLRGIFALAIADERPERRRLWLARDPLGVKPLYYLALPDAFLFASELKALRASSVLSTEISHAGLVGYLLLGSVPNPLTIYRDARGLEPGCSLSVSLDDPRQVAPVRRYWQMPVTERRIERAEAVTELRRLLEKAVRSQLVSDVPLGAFLSGGLDSSVVVGLMRQATSGPIRTCSIAFTERAYDESSHARAVANHIGADHHERLITAGDVERELPAILRAMDQPTLDGVNTYFVSQTAHGASLTVALSGLGGDELFGGYANTFVGVPQLVRAVGALRRLPPLAGLARAGINALPQRDRLAKAVDALDRPPSAASAYLARRGLFSPTEVQRLLGPEVWRSAAAEFDPVEHIAERAIQNGHNSTYTSRPLSWISRAELSTYMHHQLLRDTDVMSMAHSLEVRVPLLDQAVVEFVLSLPDAVKRRQGRPKTLLADAAGSLASPHPGVGRPKQGFTFPLAEWLRGSLRPQINELLHTNDDLGLLNKAETLRVWQQFQAGRMHWSRPWSLAVVNAFAHE